MKVIQVTDEDAKALVNDLKLELLDPESRFAGMLELHGVEDTVRNIHGAMQYKVIRWLQKHGADLHV